MDKDKGVNLEDEDDNIAASAIAEGGMPAPDGKPKKKRNSRARKAFLTVAGMVGVGVMVAQEYYLTLGVGAGVIALTSLAFWLTPKVTKNWPKDKKRKMRKRVSWLLSIVLASAALWFAAPAVIGLSVGLKIFIGSIISLITVVPFLWTMAGKSKVADDLFRLPLRWAFGDVVFNGAIRTPLSWISAVMFWFRKTLFSEKKQKNDNDGKPKKLRDLWRDMRGIDHDITAHQMKVAWFQSLGFKDAVRTLQRNWENTYKFQWQWNFLSFNKKGLAQLLNPLIMAGNAGLAAFYVLTIPAVLMANILSVVVRGLRPEIVPKEETLDRRNRKILSPASTVAARSASLLRDYLDYAEKQSIEGPIKGFFHIVILGLIMSPLPMAWSPIIPLINSVFSVALSQVMGKEANENDHEAARKLARMFNNEVLMDEYKEYLNKEADPDGYYRLNIEKVTKINGIPQIAKKLKAIIENTTVEGAKKDLPDFFDWLISNVFKFTIDSVDEVAKDIHTAFIKERDKNIEEATVSSAPSRRKKKRRDKNKDAGDKPTASASNPQVVEKQDGGTVPSSKSDKGGSSTGDETVKTTTKVEETPNLWGAKKKRPKAPGNDM